METAEHMEESKPVRRWIGLTEAANLLKVSSYTIRRWGYTGLLHYRETTYGREYDVVSVRKLREQRKAEGKQ